MDLAELREKILAADSGLTVADIVDLDLLAELPEAIVEAFSPLRVVWGKNRFWGKEAFLGKEDHIELGHKRGHHVAAHPAWAGFEVEDAAEILRVELEGTLLHELGHSVLHIAMADEPDVMVAVKQAMEQDGPVTEYYGQTERDVADEQFAEAFRWWVVGGESFEAENPAWTNAINDALDAAEGWSA